jgi:DNA polymerase-4
MNADERADTLPAWNGRAILHVDLDAFFASVEQLDHPEWRGRPVIVGGSPDGRGVVSTASYEARRYGIGSAMPAARAARLAPADTVWARPRFERYKELSDAVFAILRSVSPLVQPLSIDEAFVDATPGRDGSDDPVALAVRIADEVALLGITCSIGVAASKTVAKIASDFEKPRGITVVRPGDEATFLAPLPVEAMSGIGPKTAARLRSMGISTLGALAALDPPTTAEILGIHGSELVRRAAGIDERVIGGRDPVKSVSNERTFAADLRESADIEGALTSLAARVARRLRRKEMAGKTVQVKVRFSDFTTRTVRRTIDVPTDSELIIAPLALELVRSVWNPGVGVRLLGVGVSGIEDVHEQLGLFSDGDSDSCADPRSERLIKGLDAVRERFGDDAIKRGL